jgi:hypothetical protein
MRPRGEIGSLGHVENTELRAKLKHKRGLRVLYSVGQISKEKELSGINCPFGKHVCTDST